MSTTQTLVVLIVGLLLACPLSSSASCYKEKCSVGSAYCDHIEERCSPCSHNLCRIPSIPPACQQMCKALKAATTKIWEENDGNDFSKGSDNSAVSYTILVHTTLHTVLILTAIIYYIRKKHFTSNTDNTQSRFTSSFPQKRLQELPAYDLANNAVNNVQRLSSPREEASVGTENQINEARHLRLDSIPLVQIPTPTNCVRQVEESCTVSGQAERQEECHRSDFVDAERFPVSATGVHDRPMASVHNRTPNTSSSGQLNSNQPLSVDPNDDILLESPSLNRQSQSNPLPGSFHLLSADHPACPQMTSLSGQPDMTTPKVFD